MEDYDDKFELFQVCVRRSNRQGWGWLPPDIIRMIRMDMKRMIDADREYKVQVDVMVNTLMNKVSETNKNKLLPKFFVEVQSRNLVQTRHLANALHARMMKEYITPLAIWGADLVKSRETVFFHLRDIVLPLIESTEGLLDLLWLVALDELRYRNTSTPPVNDRTEFSDRRLAVGNIIFLAQLFQLKLVPATSFEPVISEMTTAVKDQSVSSAVMQKRIEILCRLLLSIERKHEINVDVISDAEETLAVFVSADVATKLPVRLRLMIGDAIHPVESTQTQ